MKHLQSNPYGLFSPRRQPTDRTAWLMDGLLVGWVVIVFLAVLSLTSCSSINSAASAGINAGVGNYATARENIQKLDDMKFRLWADGACAIPIGALQRNATGNPEAVNAVFQACPVPNVGVVTVHGGAGALSIQMPAK